MMLGFVDGVEVVAIITRVLGALAPWGWMH